MTDYHENQTKLAMRFYGEIATVILRSINNKKEVPFTLDNSRVQRTLLTETSTARVDWSLELLNPSGHQTRSFWIHWPVGLR